MQKISNSEELTKAIQQLEKQQSDEIIALKEHFFATVESFKPVNLLNDSIQSIIASSELKTNLTKLAVGGASGLIAKHLLVGESSKPITKLMGVVVELLVSKNVIQNADSIKSFGNTIFNKIMHRFSDSKTEE